METCSSGIYQIKNTINGRVYVGSTNNFKWREYSHNINLENKKHHSAKLQNAYNKYGKDSFQFSILEYVVNIGELLDREQYWIDELNAFSKGYNMRPRAESNCGHKPSAETRLKMSKARTGRIVSQEERQKKRDALKGRPLTMETRQKLSEAAKGRRHTEESKRKMSEARKGRRASEESRQKMSEAQKGKIISVEARQKMSAAKKGKKLSAETRQRMSEAHKGKRLQSEVIEKIKQSNIKTKKANKKAREDTFVVMMATKLYWDQKLAGLPSENV